MLSWPSDIASIIMLNIISIGIVLSWNMQLTSEYEEIASYQLYAYQEGSAPPSTTLWKKVGDVKALPLPMACTLTQVTAHVVISRLLVIYRDTLMLHQFVNKILKNPLVQNWKTRGTGSSIDQF